MKLGFNDVLQYNSASYGSPTWVTVPLVVDLNKDDHMTEAEAGTRGAGGFQQWEPALRNIGAEFQMRLDPADTAFLALQTAYRARTAKDFRIANSTASGSRYIRFDGKLFKFAEGQPLDGVDTVDCAIKPCPSSNAVTEGTI